jgi:hypothetical protein
MSVSNAVNVRQVGDRSAEITVGEARALVTFDDSPRTFVALSGLCNAMELDALARDASVSMVRAPITRTVGQDSPMSR